ncbi:MurR/RpiR family transcriptional regulator [Ornithinibacillus californiensis]|uniref:MurR/RpiR family transcriptional regulator n=1 Tax=Ornithinibacillus californiensis TaxID=161536 RepID=UPI00064DD0CE|nr:MurR/RpiR family transcriptional regulator [Ornithinibacillus californiensis]
MSEYENSRNKAIQRIIEIQETLPKKQKQLTYYILKNYQSIGLITVKELAASAGVGISTVMRLLKVLGYDNFNDFRKEIYDAYEPPITRWTYSKKSYESSDTDDKEGQTVFQVWKEAVNILDKSLTPDLIENFPKAIDLMLKASQINILGSRPYKATALYLELILGEFCSKVRQLSHDTEVLYDKLLQFQKDEVIVVFMFEPYSYRSIEAVKFAYEQGNKIILITDHISCPITPYASVTLKLEYSTEQFSIIPIIALIEALVIELGKQTDNSIEKMERLQQALVEKNIQKTLGYKWNMSRE